ncbi:MAG: glutathione S-transferase [Rhodospirillaceae bacterium]|nr:glutathione S-transferase [Rhodospirillaceae bacterium]
MKFYDCSTAPSPRRARIALAEKGLLDDIEVIEINLRNKEQITPEFTTINPYRTVPVLELDDGRRITSSTGIFHYLEAARPDPPLIGRSPAEKGLVTDLEWRVELEGFSPIGECLRNTAKGMIGRALTGKYDYEQIPELGARGRLRCERFLQDFDDLVGERRFLAGDNFTIADITALVAIDFAKWIKIELPKDATNAQRWYTEVSSRPSADC